ncbi:probable methyltransferase PMT26 [Tanacetum coccineum]
MQRIGIGLTNDIISDVLAMSFAPKDEHEAQVQFALERGIPAISAVMGTQRLPYHARVFDIVHCARCRVPWHIEGGKLLLELNCVLRPGGYFVWSATPIYHKHPEYVGIWEESTSACMHAQGNLVVEPRAWFPVALNKRPLRAEKAPLLLLSSQVGVYGKPAPEDFSADFKHWKRVVNKSY